jgi:hypothetical protein
MSPPDAGNRRKYTPIVITITTIRNVDRKALVSDFPEAMSRTKYIQSSAENSMNIKDIDGVKRNGPGAESH